MVYERAERRAAAGREAAAPERGAPRQTSEAVRFARERALIAARAELWLARLAVPGALLAWWVLVRTGLGGFAARALSGMWLHELGHAAAAWLCGYPAFPGPWFTPVAEERSGLFALTLVAALGWAVWRGRTSGQRRLAAAGAVVLAMQLVCTLALSERAAQMLITFSGYSGSLLFGAALMATFFVPPGHPLHRDWLRWGLLAIGAAGFVDAFDEWWRARADFSVIGFGEIEGHGPTDATKLVDVHRWTTRMMTGRYLAIGVLCLLALAALQLRHVRRTRRALAELEAGSRAGE